MGSVARGRAQDVHVRTEKLMSRRTRALAGRTGHFPTLSAHPQRECVHCRSNCAAIRTFEWNFNYFPIFDRARTFSARRCSCGRREKFSLRSSETVSRMLTAELAAGAAAVAPSAQSAQGYE